MFTGGRVERASTLPPPSLLAAPSPWYGSLTLPPPHQANPALISYQRFLLYTSKDLLGPPHSILRDYFSEILSSSGLRSNVFS